MCQEMGLVRVYTKPQGQQPDFTDPVVLSAVCEIFPIIHALLHCRIHAWNFCSSLKPISLFLLLCVCDRIEVAAWLKTFVTTYIGV
ncbi:hypothetical protein SLEP1_g13444 [Rubroshorea leprosula]|uniref:Uncharacterized protein n=1 Tax=Rubroshorea leprosula TaxID=152421 RepID=A0AAV5ILY3_9ROSI|nr:hypothetical protein SLEP1_g13444 [Rubroshorea leprosula]